MDRNIRNNNIVITVKTTATFIFRSSWVLYTYSTKIKGTQVFFDMNCIRYSIYSTHSWWSIWQLFRKPSCCVPIMTLLPNTSSCTACLLCLLVPNPCAHQKTASCISITYSFDSLEKYESYQQQTLNKITYVSRSNHPTWIYIIA